MKAIVILGMHRSGTSATALALGRLGASMGPTASMGEYWENKPMRQVNEDLLEALGGGWDCPPLLEDGWVESPAARALLPRARQVLAEEYGDAPLTVWKDPRSCMTLPFWRQVFDEEPVVVFVKRHPTEVAASLLSRDHLNRGHAYAMWERYSGDALTNSVGLPTVVIDYTSLVEDPVGTMTGLADSLARFGVSLPNDPATTDMDLSPGRRHHQAGAAEALDDPVATDSQRDLFSLLAEVDGAEDRFSLPRPVPPPHPLSVELLGLAARARASRLDAQRLRNKLDGALGSPSKLIRTLIEQAKVHLRPRGRSGGDHLRAVRSSTGPTGGSSGVSG